METPERGRASSGLRLAGSSPMGARQPVGRAHEIKVRPSNAAASLGVPPQSPPSARLHELSQILTPGRPSDAASPLQELIDAGAGGADQG